jgi:hypothetical protein
MGVGDAKKSVDPRHIEPTKNNQQTKTKKKGERKASSETHRQRRARPTTLTAVKQ